VRIFAKTDSRNAFSENLVMHCVRTLKLSVLFGFDFF